MRVGMGASKQAVHAIQHVALSLIDIGDRLRATDPAYVDVLRSSILQNRTDAHSGLLCPVELRPTKGGRFSLVAGGHRLAAIQAIGDDGIDAVVVKVGPLEARLREIDENLVRRELSPLDRASFLFERKRVWEEIYPETKRGKTGALARWYDASAQSAFASEAAKKTGLALRTVQKDIAVWERLSDDSRQRLRGTWLAGNLSQLNALSKLGANMQARVLDIMLREEAPAATVVAATAEAEGQRPRPCVTKDDEDFAALVARWGRASAKTKANFRDFLDKEESRPSRPALKVVRS